MRLPSGTRPWSVSFEGLPALVVALVLSGCSFPVATDAGADPALILAERSADDVGEALDEVSRHLGADLSSDEDLALAWSDFDHDVRSIVKDLIRNPARVDSDGIMKRMEALEAMIGQSQVELPAEPWERFLVAFTSLIRQTQGDGETASIEHMFA